MSIPILATKLYPPHQRLEVIVRTRLIDRLNASLQGKLTLVSAPAGFGKTTLVSMWVNQCERPVAWLSLDEDDKDISRFLAYFIAGVQQINSQIGVTLLPALQSPQPPIKTILTALSNEITSYADDFIFVMDDYHAIDAPVIDGAITFLLNHLPPQMHLLIITREDPQLPLARLRARYQLTELRASDLRFTPEETMRFFYEVMGLQLSQEAITTLDIRTEGWIAGLQLAGLSLQGHHNADDFLTSFKGSHRFVLDYLAQEVLQQQPAHIQDFLLQTSILERMCGDLCDALMQGASGEGQVMLEALDRANLFIVPLDAERRWYRYHHLFADLLRQKFRQTLTETSPQLVQNRLNELHIRASEWYEANELELEAFHHAALGQDTDRAERIVAGGGISMIFRGAVMRVIDWLASLPKDVLHERPWLLMQHASLLLVNGHTTGVEELLQRAESALQTMQANEQIRSWSGRIANMRATVALTRYDVDAMLIQVHRALEDLQPDNFASLAVTYWVLGYTHIFQKEYDKAREPLLKSINFSQLVGNTFTKVLAMVGLGIVEEAEMQLHRAKEIYEQVLQSVGEQPPQIIAEAYIGLARIAYEWNNLTTAEAYARESLYHAHQYDTVIDRFISSDIFLTRLKMVHGDIGQAEAILAQTSQIIHQKQFLQRLPELINAQIPVLLHQGKLTTAEHLTEKYQQALGQARVYLAMNKTSQALAVLNTYHEATKAKHWYDELLRITILQALALHQDKQTEQALVKLKQALTMAYTEGFVRVFVDEGEPMMTLLSPLAQQNFMTDYINLLLSAFEKEPSSQKAPLQESLFEPLSEREREILHLIAHGFSNQEIGVKLFIALDTVKGHNRRIFGKLSVQRRTEAIARARELGLV